MEKVLNEGRDLRTIPTQHSVFDDTGYSSELHKPENAVPPKLLEAYSHGLSEDKTESTEVRKVKCSSPPPPQWITMDHS